MKLQTQLLLIAGALYEKLSDLTKGSGKLINEYFDDEKNIEHLSLMLYDLLPLSFKLALRHEKFHKGLKLIVNNLRQEIVVNEHLNKSLSSKTQELEKRNLFNEINEGFEALKNEREGQVELKKTVVKRKPRKTSPKV